MDELDILRRRLQRKRKKLDKEAPEHGYDSALFLAAKAGGLQDAVAMIDEIRKPKGRVIKLDPSSQVGSVVRAKPPGGQHRGS